jgi:hypothetical protein
MRKPPTDFICPNCHEPVDPTKPNAMMNAATNAWQHKDCWTKQPTPVDPTTSDKQPWRGER